MMSSRFRRTLVVSVGTKLDRVEQSGTRNVGVWILVEQRPRNTALDVVHLTSRANNDGQKFLSHGLEDRGPSAWFEPLRLAVELAPDGIEEAATDNEVEDRGVRELRRRGTDGDDDVDVDADSDGAVDSDSDSDVGPDGGFDADVDAEGPECKEDVDCSNGMCPIRGGDHHDPVEANHCCDRESTAPDAATGYGTIGFRCCLTPSSR